MCLLAPTGLGHVFAIVCYLSWIVRITHSSKPDRLVITFQLAFTVLQSFSLPHSPHAPVAGAGLGSLAPRPAVLQQASHPYTALATSHLAQNVQDAIGWKTGLSKSLGIQVQQNCKCTPSAAHTNALNKDTRFSMQGHRWEHQ